MSGTITSGATTITPFEITAYEAENDSQNVLHSHLDGSIGVSLKRDRPRNGILPLLFDDEAAAWAAHDALTEPAVWTLTHPVVAPVGMTFVREGRMRILLDEDTRYLWILEVGFQEVTS